MPDDMTTPNMTPNEAMINTVRKVATRAPIAD